jgi:hypothetical protein
MVWRLVTATVVYLRKLLATIVGAIVVLLMSLAKTVLTVMAIVATLYSLSNTTGHIPYVQDVSREISIGWHMGIVDVRRFLSTILDSEEGNDA